MNTKVHERPVSLNSAGGNSTAHQQLVRVAEASAHAELRNTLGAVKTSLVLKDDTSIQVAFVQECVHDALLAVSHLDCTDLSAAHDDHRRACLAGVAVRFQIKAALIVIELNKEGSGVHRLANDVLRRIHQPSTV
eukprot:CAMPEP_0177233660 /NCGR_PEP_ID=MMETSP0367-20130122/43983_1 /TAXON_ID=447022 ORGANISM="Scrippsiella hangoei-like, Strain SHHI-4" /NCGR_SAMPLE_ID=MMETSP0367 /ASSEMBLY_ACC=CAM_ASM_000362 /LENGTH=134 /DNA_ID=CAMNT_0018684405 /DNA_START=41 /DNA_END=445 /DNA_ORIENTATION=+